MDYIIYHDTNCKCTGDDVNIPQTQYNAISDKVAWKSLYNMVDRFGFTPEEGRILMGGMSRSTYFNGLQKFSGKLNRDQKERISYLLGIYKDLRILFTDSRQALSWIER